MPRRPAAARADAGRAGADRTDAGRPEAGRAGAVCAPPPDAPSSGRPARAGAAALAGRGGVRARAAAAAGLAAVLLLAGPGAAPARAQDAPPNPHVVIETSEGDITVELFRPDAPVSVVNFLTYVQAGYYDGTIFHRVIRNLIIQGGGLNQDHTPRIEGLRGGILNEATNRRQNRRGTIAMARLGTPNSARAQFFINVGHNDAFNHRNTTPDGFGYAVFGRVVDGMDVVDDISRTRTTRVGPMDDVPRENIVIHTIRRVDP